MKFSHGVTFAFFLAFILILPILVNSNRLAVASELESEYTAYINAACKAGLSAAYDNTTDGDVFSESSNRELAVETYYKTLAECFNTEASTEEDMAKYCTPCIILVSNDGYYIEYIETRKGSDGHYYDSDIITPIYKWVKRYNGFAIEYHLDTSISLEYEGKIHSGTYDEIRAEFDDNPRISYQLSDTVFFDEKRDIITGDIEKQLEYFVNEHDGFYNQKNDFTYQFTLPKISGESWGRMLEQPTIIGFLQGRQLQYKDRVLNAYSFSGNEMEEEKQYYIKKVGDTLYYHEMDCPEVSGMKGKSYTMTEAAKKGAFPHSCVK